MKSEMAPCENELGNGQKQFNHKMAFNRAGVSTVCVKCGHKGEVFNRA